MLAGEFGEPRRWAIAHQIAVGEFFDAADLVPVSQAHVMADTESLGEAGISFLEGLAGAPERRAAGPGPDPDRSARPRCAGLQAARPERGHARPRSARDRRTPRLRRADDRHLHQLSDDHAAGPRRASRDGRHRRGDLHQQRFRRAQQFRGRAVRARRRADRAHAALRLSPRRMPPADPTFPARGDAARPVGMGCARRHCRAGMRLLLGGAADRGHRRTSRLGRAEAFRRRARQLRLGRAVSYARHHRR